MRANLKRDQLPADQVKNWIDNFDEEDKYSFNLAIKQIILQKETYKILSGENENRVRIYLGLEPNKENDKYVLCAYAVSAFLLGSGDVYADYETPVFKLGKENINFSNKTSVVLEDIASYKKWREGELDPENEMAKFRRFIYPKAFLLTQFELHEIFNVQKKGEAEIFLGISKAMQVMISGTEGIGDLISAEVFGFAGVCPPICGEKSIYNL